MIQPLPFPDEYLRGHVIGGFVTWSSVSEQRSKTSIGGQLAVGGRMREKLVSNEVKRRSEGSWLVVEE
jgi:hypothetical protein